MKLLKKLLMTKIGIIVLCVGGLLVLILCLVCAITGASIGADSAYGNETFEQIETPNKEVDNCGLYVDRYKEILNKHLLSDGYVTLERLIFYLQHDNGVLDTRNLSYEVWEEAYLANLDLERKQMIPIKTICKTKNFQPFEQWIEISDDNNEFLEINLCKVDGVDITTSNNFSEDFKNMPYIFPIKDDFTITSFIFESRNVILMADQFLEDVHDAWDLAVPIGTDFYSICTGTITDIVNTQFDDNSYDVSKNDVGNYVTVACENGPTVTYRHIKANSVPSEYKVNSSIARGDLLGKTSTTGMSTGPHLHLEMKSAEGETLDALEYINLNID